jgi:hypothetical protein
MGVSALKNHSPGCSSAAAENSSEPAVLKPAAEHATTAVLAPTTDVGGRGAGLGARGQGRRPGLVLGGLAPYPDVRPWGNRERITGILP